jgi:hypothetical protein
MGAMDTFEEMEEYPVAMEETGEDDERDRPNIAPWEELACTVLWQQLALRQITIAKKGCGSIHVTHRYKSGSAASTWAELCSTAADSNPANEDAPARGDVGGGVKEVTCICRSAPKTVKKCTPVTG